MALHFQTPASTGAVAINNTEQTVPGVTGTFYFTLGFVEYWAWVGITAAAALSDIQVIVRTEFGVHTAVRFPLPANASCRMFLPAIATVAESRRTISMTIQDFLAAGRTLTGGDAFVVVKNLPLYSARVPGELLS